MTYTTLKQATELSKLGLPNSTADMHYEQYINSPGYWKVGIGKPYGEQIPCWSAEVLLKMLPKVLYYDEDTISHRFIHSDKSDNYEIFYEGEDTFAWEHHSSGTLIECLIDTIKWFYETRSIKNQLNLNYDTH